HAFSVCFSVNGKTLIANDQFFGEGYNMNSGLIREVLKSDNFKPEIAYRHLVNNIREVSEKAGE
ncbi:hypothetical protein, partial [Vibrio owensii]|uniref:hypothetical protein n=1 Tax=Vibrio owensii TaxID=696485 RepID=UPI004067B4B5